MQPIGPLMWEHRLIERGVELLKAESTRLQQGGEPDADWKETMVGFFRTYADACHHGKEEDILFEEMREKDLTKEHGDMLQELVEDHKKGRKMVQELEDAAKAEDVAGALDGLAAFYPKHIAKEDKTFFHPSMEYFTEEERDAMLQRFEEFEKQFDHDKWEKTIEKLEERKK